MGRGIRSYRVLGADGKRVVPRGHREPEITPETCNPSQSKFCFNCNLCDEFGKRVRLRSNPPPELVLSKKSGILSPQYERNPLYDKYLEALEPWNPRRS